MVLVALVVAVAGCKTERRSPLVEAARACHDDDAEVSCGRPIFNVANLQASLGYYRDVLGFKVDWTDGNPADFGSVTRGNGTLFLCQGCQGTPGAWAWFFARDVDALHREMAAKKAKIRMAPKDMPWRMREMHVSDLDGNVMRFATGLDD